MRNPNRYASILRIRQQAEDHEARILTSLRGEIQQAQRQRTSLELTRQATLDRAGTSLREHFDAESIRGYYQYERHMAHLRDQKDSEIRALERKAEEQRAVLEGATKERRIAQRLHERRWERYRTYLRKEEQKILDETATMYAARTAEPSETLVERGKKPPW